MSADITVPVTNKKGLHARAAAKFVKTASQFEAVVRVSKVAGAGVTDASAQVEASGGSILGLMMLGAECGSTIRMRSECEQGSAAVDALRKLVEEKFQESE